MLQASLSFCLGTGVLRHSAGGAYVHRDQSRRQLEVLEEIQARKHEETAGQARQEADAVTGPV